MAFWKVSPTNKLAQLCLRNCLVTTRSQGGHEGHCRAKNGAATLVPESVWFRGRHRAQPVIPKEAEGLSAFRVYIAG